ncbi:hypothetical protein KSS93_06770 [Pseudomonas xanthosomatis]|uniref:hypothetical protein n=1 Tax=Pseudomonas xanthosomatis TaxID=2842356 RepID=UPI001C3DFCD6|nr:hypothetical protein [Pseudomonas xanthosomatis]QXH47618.1 hypothetical protein KSS93_06770 [Pseudomonas xanthosomatis]
MIKQDGLSVTALPGQGGYRLVIDDVQGAKKYESLLLAKEFAFDFIDSGQAAEYMKQRGLRR